MLADRRRPKWLVRVPSPLLSLNARCFVSHSRKEPGPNSRVPPLDSWPLALRPSALADRLHAAVVIAVKIARGAGYQISLPSETQPQFEIAESPSEDWALPRPVQEAIRLLDLANEIVPLLAADPPTANAALVEQAFTAGELAARMPAWSNVNPRSRGG